MRYRATVTVRKPKYAQGCPIIVYWDRPPAELPRVPPARSQSPPGTRLELAMNRPVRIESAVASATPGCGLPVTAMSRLRGPEGSVYAGIRSREPGAGSREPGAGSRAVSGVGAARSPRHPPHSCRAADAMGRACHARRERPPTPDRRPAPSGGTCLLFPFSRLRSAAPAHRARADVPAPHSPHPAARRGAAQAQISSPAASHVGHAYARAPMPPRMAGQSAASCRRCKGNPCAFEYTATPAQRMDSSC